MAAGGRLPVLRITYEELALRSRELSEKKQAIIGPEENVSRNVVQQALQDEGSARCQRNTLNSGYSTDEKCTSSASTASNTIAEPTAGRLQIKPTRMSSGPLSDKESTPNNHEMESRIEESREERGHEGTSHRGGLIAVDKNAFSNSRQKRRSSAPLNTRQGGVAASSRRMESEKDTQAKSKGKDKGLDPEVAGWLADLKHHEGQMEKALPRWSGDAAKFDQIVQICHRLQSACEKLILMDLETFSRVDIGSRVWRSTHYSIIEVLRKQLQRFPEREAGMKELLLRFLKDSEGFYTTLIKGMQKQYGFHLSHLLSGNVQFQSKTHHRTVMMAIFVCHWCYICLGDLCRYQQQFANKPEWSKPRSYYLKAQQLAPKDGKPYNQLAVIAINAHRRLDAVYYYMRSLTAKNPFQSAYDSLVGLFEESSRKVKKQEVEERRAKEKAEREAVRQRQRREKRANKKLQKQKTKQPAERHEQVYPSGRREIWIMPGCEEKPPVDEGSRQREETPEPMAEQTSNPDLTKKLINAFLVVHGKLFTRIGIETFDRALERFLVLWNSQLQREVSLQDASRFLKMMIINIFSLHHAANTYSDNDTGMKYYCSLGFRLTLQVTLTLLQACNVQLSPLHVPPRRALQDGGQQVVEQDIKSDEHGESVCRDREVEYSSALLSSGGSDFRIDSGDSSITTTSGEGEDIAHKISSLTCSESDCGLHTISLPTDPTLLSTLDTLTIFLPAVRVWFDWLVHQRDLWVQFVPLVPRDTMHAFWTTTFELLNRCLGVFGITESALSAPSAKCPKLWEDKMLAGFMPLKASLSTEDTFTIPDAMQLSAKQHQEQCFRRVILLVKACRFLTTESHLGIRYDPASRYFSIEEPVGGVVSPDSVSDHMDKIIVSNSEESDESSGEDVVVEGSSEEEDEEEEAAGPGDRETPVEPMDEEIEQLKVQKERLTKQIEEQHQAMETAKTLLDEAAKKESQEVCVAPKYLVPDTNCFVDMLPSIRTLVKSGLFTVTIPLTVLAELEGLGKETERQNSVRVSTGAKSALDYITTEFSSKNAHLRALTTQGNRLQSLSFRAEVTGKASNDDLILQSCLCLHNSVDRGKSAGRGKGEFYSVVLLTDDRNLRVKAHADNLPVKDIPAFMELFKTTRR